VADVVCLGILVADVWGKPINELPERGRLSLVDEIGIGVGGCAANTGLSLVKIGGDVAIMGKVGTDGFGDFALETLRSGGADVSGVLRDSSVGTSATMIMLDDSGERTFIHYIGANSQVRPDELDMDLIRSAKVFHFAGALVMPGFDGEPAASVLKAAKEAGVITSVDTVWDATGRWMELMAPLFPHTDLFLPSLSEAVEITGRTDPADVAAVLMDLGVETVGLKMGPEGSYVRRGEEAITVPAYAVEAQDGTGAGDAFVAGFLRGHLLGWDLERTARFANAAGALCTTGLGTTAGVRDFEGTLDFLREREGGYWRDVPGI
jgi:sugar/nucleoside kinase (ribokinase family)